MKHLFLIVSLLWVFTSCSKKDEAPAVVINQPQLQVHFDEEHQFALTQGNNTLDASQYKWTSSNETVGTVDATGKFSGNRIGETTITGTSADGKNRVESKVTVIPYVNAFAKEPVMDFGNSKATVKSKETRELVGEETQVLAYKGENEKVVLVGYYFENAALVQSNLYFANTNKQDDIVNYYAERYEFLGRTQDDILVFAFSNQVIVGLYIDEELKLVTAAFLKQTQSGGRMPATSFKGVSATKLKTSVSFK
ncbi:Ig-like domain-containing protein [Siphonobacter sp.]|uniref:Ig-like domain-containing protein n=1 Tax=Siphonobacter sp. TaxID=1869184 RepID=UPI003B3B8C3A